MNANVNSLSAITSPKSLRADLIGARGYNAVQRVLPALAPYVDHLDLVGYDLAAGPETIHHFPIVQVHDNADLASRLRTRRPDVVWIETPDDVHRTHIELALEAGARQVLCEKCLAFDAVEGAAVLRRCRQAEPRQHVRFIDHYLLLALVRTLFANTAAWLGRVRRISVTLLESQGIPRHQEPSHANGMTNFFHHVVALGGLWFDLNDLAPTEAAWAQHPETTVPDTYRAAKFGSGRTGEIVLEGAVGKYLPRPRKQIYIEGTHGQAWIDRDRNELRIHPRVGRSFSLPAGAGDTGYAALARALVAGTPLPQLLAPAQALQALRLVEQAHAMACLEPVYGDPSCPEEAFVCDWESVSVS